jgi:hypothetical protein
MLLTGRADSRRRVHMATLDDLLAELSGVLMQLDDVPAGSVERHRLERRRDELREHLRGVDLDARRPTAELLEEHASLAARLRAAKKERVKKVTTKYLGATQTVGGGVEPAEINKMLDERNRVDELQQRFDHLTEILHERGAL